MNDETTVLSDGLQVFEVESLCRVLENAGVRFRVDRVSAEECGIVESRKNNWAAGLTSVCNYFNRGGLSEHMRISVHKDDFDKATAALEAANTPKPKDKKKLVIGIVLAVVAFLFLYAFATRKMKYDDQPESPVEWYNERSGVPANH